MAPLYRLWHRRHQEDNRSGEQSTGKNSLGVSKGKSVYDKAVLRSMSGLEERVAGLTDKEYELYLLLVEGFTPKECAKLLNIRNSTEQASMREVFRKLMVSTRAELIITYRGIRK